MDVLMTAKRVNGRIHIWMTDDVEAVEQWPVHPDFIFSKPDDVYGIIDLIPMDDMAEFACGFAVGLVG